MPRRAGLWLREKNGRPDSWYVGKLRLKTKDASEARRRARLAKEGSWPPPEKAAAQQTAEAFKVEAPATPPPFSPAPPAAPAGEASPVVDAEPLTGDWTAAAEAAAAPAAAEPEEPPEPAEDDLSNEQLAQLIVTGTLKSAEIFAQRKVYENFVAPEFPAEARAPLEKEWVKLLDGCGINIKLPPWVTQIVVPAITICAATGVVFKAFAGEAAKQKAAAAAAGGA